ncbi:MAG: VUT family protein [Patescibacteria group bacterium]
MNNRYILGFLYIFTIVMSNYFASTIVINLPGTFALTLGTIIFSLVFVLRDYIHRFGKKYIYTLISLALIISGIVNFSTQVPIQIVIASALGLFFGEATDTEVFERLAKFNWLTRALTSNAVSVPLDSLIFNTIAFSATDLQSSIPILTSADIVYKLVISIVVSLGIAKSFGTFLNNKKIA